MGFKTLVFDRQAQARSHIARNPQWSAFVSGGRDEPLGALDKQLNAAGHVHLQPGQTVRVGWQTEDCRALDAP